MLGAKSVTILLGLIAVFAVSGLILIGLSQQLPSQEQQRQDQQQPASQHTPANEKAAVDKDNQTSGWTKIKQAIERNEKVVSAISSAVIAAFTVALVLATGFLYFSSEKVADAAKKSAEVAEGTLVSTNRPWIQVKFIGIEGPLGFGPAFGDDVGGGVDIILLVRNVGKSPAIRVGADLRLASTFDLLANQREFCDAIKRSRDPILEPNVLRPENTLFPEDEINIRVRAWTHPEQIQQARQRAANMPDNKANLALVGCVYYEFPFAPGFHQTGIIFDLKKKTLYPANTPPASYSAVPLDQYTPNLRTYNPDRTSDGVRLEGTIPADDLVLSRSQVGTGPID
jgi:hypothetical protein